ncbi:lipopolysaccharide heptosyltransferase I [Helicobacter kayseriensis]|uniref:lipopolysaccharide heptosyltransferase I n=1 Tax=Helicobacter kayseriensis TaxID=2905877 RepID=UPI001E5C3947|nr:lipopolysaccharide heptosyltransferase I [Helicobacter kayseriensis]MCE3048320.1 lipopolysaccharide heptosyltransferase I [Helicobacter kayseriensis]
MKIGIIKLSSLGDIVVAMSFLPMLKAQGHEIDWFIDSCFEEIAHHSPCIDNLISLPLKQAIKSKNYSTIPQIYKQLKQCPQYDLLIDMQGLIKSAIIGKWIPKKVFRGFGFSSCKESLSALFYSQRVHISYQANILKRNAKLLSLPIPSCTKDAFGYSPQAQKTISNLLNSPSKKVLLLLEASRPTKMYPLLHFKTLCESLKNENITFLVPHHMYPKEAQEFCADTQATLLPKLNLDEIKALVSSVDAVIGGDTGITHLAWAMNKPSITLYGNTPLERFCLHGEKNISLSGNPHANYDKNDFSIGNISPLEIKKHLLEIL